MTTRICYCDIKGSAEALEGGLDYMVGIDACKLLYVQSNTCIAAKTLEKLGYKLGVEVAHAGFKAQVEGKVASAAYVQRNQHQRLVHRQNK